MIMDVKLCFIVAICICVTSTTTTTRQHHTFVDKMKEEKFKDYNEENDISTTDEPAPITATTAKPVQKKITKELMYRYIMIYPIHILLQPILTR